MEFFNNIEKIKYEGLESNNMLAFRHYNAEEIVMGKPMKEHLKFAVAYWHTFCNDGSDPFGKGTNQRNWITEDPMQTAKNKVDANFEFLQKLGVEYFCFHDMDVAPFGNSLEEFFHNLDIITDYMKEKMDKTGIKLLWNTADRHANHIYVNGAASSPNIDVYAMSAAQVKKGIDISKKLGGKNFVFWGGREGYETLLNTDIQFEEENIARLYKMAIAYCEKINHKLTFLIEPKPKEPMTHQYDFDSATALAFLQKYDLMEHFKLNIEANHATLAGHTFEHELNVARNYNALGSIDANQGDPLLGWDTDEFPTNVYDTTLALIEVLKNGGLHDGGINFDSKVRRTSFEQEDLFIAHIAGMDTYARGLKAAARIIETGFLDNVKKDRYSSYDSELGKQLLNNELDLEVLTNHALSVKEVNNKSSHIEFVKSKLNDLIY
ncbi:MULTISPECIES: xylose isomerase [Clostridium]|jgi:xylose isomerase|uniref:xylose isomerase n=1 Tax=Clostridium TaxID=1485 RepID=UPI001DA84CF5|nr:MULTISPECIES: xylose isomerase [Clostridium]MBS5308517.1 xylose isomerase [Clostridium sp.]MDB1934274.1 xylose isomerase [Clostridium tertium]MDB1937227.1 xylose isomerase [Clostridium tertium]MDB1945085.1 xylose isomerase [Clostridium tertium]MDB1953054.1 xylose isomerase [Clostridium tertium]